MVILAHVLVPIVYLMLAWGVWRRPRYALVPDGSGRLGQLSGLASLALLLAWLAHATLLRAAAVGDGTWRFGFALALSATMWLVIALVWVENRFEPLGGLWIVVLPLAAICAPLPLVFPGSPALGRISGADDGTSGWLPVHLAVALAAYSLMTIAAVHALLMAALDRWLHHMPTGPDAGGASTGGRTGGHRVLASLPPLLTMERILFRLIGLGFVLLTLTVASGALFSEALFGQPFRFDHKTVFTLIAWLVFGALLVGRFARGWRGRLALSWTLSGFAMLFLAYAGSRFVLEVVLHRV
jgi:ABC-type uncharacterized transport system permease subunit